MEYARVVLVMQPNMIDDRQAVFFRQHILDRISYAGYVKLVCLLNFRQDSLLYTVKYSLGNERMV